jgi:uroporphyrinogen-III synthase
MRQATIAEHRQAVMVLARRSARKAIKAKLKAQGVKVSLVPLCEIIALVNDYLAEHPGVLHR